MEKEYGYNTHIIVDKIEDVRKSSEKYEVKNNKLSNSDSIPKSILENLYRIYSNEFDIDKMSKKIEDINKELVDFVNRKSKIKYFEDIHSSFSDKVNKSTIRLCDSNNDVYVDENTKLIIDSFIESGSPIIGSIEIMTYMILTCNNDIMETYRFMSINNFDTNLREWYDNAFDYYGRNNKELKFVKIYDVYKSMSNGGVNHSSRTIEAYNIPEESIDIMKPNFIDKLNIYFDCVSIDNNIVFH